MSSDGLHTYNRHEFLMLKTPMTDCGCTRRIADPQGCAEAASSLITEGREDKAVTNRLLNISVRERGATDNCSVLLIRMVAHTGNGGTRQ